MFEGVLTKMKTSIGEPTNYYLDLDNDFLHINQLLDKTLHIEFVKNQCLNCGKNSPIFRQGYCRSCFFEIPQAADWIIRPELSKAHLNEEDRDLSYEKAMQLQPHIVYLANSSNVKVGVTRKTQTPTRWIDQGAHEALPILETPNRYLAGITELALKEHLSDKTNWRKMLQNNIEDINLQEVRDAIVPFIPSETKAYFLHNQKEISIQYPVLQYPEKVKSLNLTKTPSYTGKLKGIKGQYWLFEDQTVFNVRSNEGLVCKIDILIS